MGFLSALNLGGNSYKLKPGNFYECQSMEQWNALTQEQQDEYDYVLIIGDEEEQDLTNAYLTTDSAASTINVNDYFPVQKTDGTKKKLLWSTIINKIKATLGTAAQKDSTDEVTENSTDLVESGAVYSEINTVNQTLTNQVEVVQGQVSNSDDAYSASKPYKVGELVIHDNVLYVCITACSAASWAVNSSCFTATTITSELSKTDEFAYVIVTPSQFPKLINNMVFYKRGHVVDVSMDGFTGLTVRNSNDMFGFIPEGFRPIVNTAFNLIGTANGEVYRLTFAPSGLLRIYPYSGVTSETNLVSSVTYLS